MESRVWNPPDKIVRCSRVTSGAKPLGLIRGFPFFGSCGSSPGERLEIGLQLKTHRRNNSGHVHIVDGRATACLMQHPLCGVLDR